MNIPVSRISTKAVTLCYLKLAHCTYEALCNTRLSRVSRVVFRSRPKLGVKETTFAVPRVVARTIYIS